MSGVLCEGASWPFVVLRGTTSTSIFNHFCHLFSDQVYTVAMKPASKWKKLDNSWSPSIPFTLLMLQLFHFPHTLQPSHMLSFLETCIHTNFFHHTILLPLHSPDYESNHEICMQLCPKVVWKNNSTQKRSPSGLSPQTTMYKSFRAWDMVLRKPNTSQKIQAQFSSGLEIAKHAQQSANHTKYTIPYH